MLQVDHVTFNAGQLVLHYHFNLAAGKILTIQGVSGVGKSTLLDLVAGFAVPDQGDICWRGESLLPLPVEKRPVSQLFQSHNLFEHLSVLENICLGLLATPPKQRQEVILTAAEQLKVADLLSRQPASLSGGQRQRMALLRTLLRPEPLVLLDEPFTGLDDSTRRRAAEWVLQHARAHNKTVLLVTHQDDDVRQLADENLYLESLTTEALQ